MEGNIENIGIISKDSKDYLEIRFAGCNYKCPWCNVPHLLETKEEFIIELREVKKQIKEHANSIEGVIFSGGEPCLQRQAILLLADFCKSHTKVFLHTNGSKPGCLQSLLQAELLDGIIFDFKCPLEDEFFEKTTRSKTFFIRSEQIIEDIKLSLNILRKFNDKIDIEIRTTIIPGLMYRKEDFMLIAHDIEMLFCRWKLQRFEPGNTVSKNFMDIKPSSQGFLDDLKESIQKKYYNLRIETD